MPAHAGHRQPAKAIAAAAPAPAPAALLLLLAAQHGGFAAEAALF